MTALQSVVEYFEGDELAAKVFENKYKGKNETLPSDMHKRIADKIAEVEIEYYNQNKQIDSDSLSKEGKEYYQNQCNNKEIISKQWFDLFDHFKYIVPGGSIMSTLGENNYASLANCFGLGKLEDKMGSIFNKGKEMSYLYMRRGGVGLCLDPLRPRGALVKNAAKTSSGAASFMELFSTITQTICQDGRRGALMLALSDTHPDIFEFVTAKQNLNKINGANISIKASRELFNKAEKDEDIILKYPCDIILKDKTYLDNLEYDKLTELSIDSKKIYLTKVKAKKLFNLIIDCAWKSAEPGLLLWDNIIDYDPASVYDNLKAVTTNPCGEQPLSDADSCRLSHINLLSFVKNPFTNEAYFDFDLFKKIVYKQVIFLDDIIDLECKNIENIISISDTKSEIDLWKRVIDIAKEGRRIGCGFTALGDAIAAMKLNFKDSHYLVEGIMETKFKTELEASIDLSILRGSFKSYDTTKEFNILSNEIGVNKWYQFLLENYSELAKRLIKYGRRNVSLSTVAPVGTGSMMSQTTSGIEPLFKYFYTRRVKCVNLNEECDFIDPNTEERFREHKVFHKGFKTFCEVYSGKPFASLTNKLINELILVSPYYKNEAEDIDWQTRLEIQSIVQKYTTSSISTTINLPSNVSKDVVENIYKNAYKMGIKGVTVYRDGCRSGILIDNKKSIDIDRKAPKRPSELLSHIHSMKVKGKEYICSLGFYEGNPYEIFVCSKPDGVDIPSIGKNIKVKRGHYQLQNSEGKIIIDNFSDVMDDELEMMTRILSISIRSNVGFNFLVDQLKKSKGDLSAFSKVLARTIAKYVDNKAKSGENCEVCGEKLIFQNGCLTCAHCGFSKCN